MKQHIIRLSVLFALFLISAAPQSSSKPQSEISSPPDKVVKLIFIHHSTGENWLTDGYGDLGKTLGENNYFVSDTNYGWGPEAIGDRTDIPNWTEWFSNANTPTYMNALFKEAEQHASYIRTLADPGGENEIIMLKSCFPNSALEGNPNDAAGTYEELSVSGAKYVYNTILRYFATRPDKLFVVITAPPLSDGTYAKNARAFNQWLVNDWLRENNYTLKNVAVFDFYNILTDPNAHHRFNNGQVEYIPGAGNTLKYPSGDDHPSVEGSRKATQEFVPMLNVFYHRWKASAPQTPSQTQNEPQPTQQANPLPQAPSAVAGSIDNFDSGTIPGTNGWEAFRDESAPASMTCGSDPNGRSGSSLKLDFNIPANGWGTCAMMYQTPQNWSAGNGLAFYLRGAKTGTPFDIDLYAGTPENRETYLHTIQLPAEGVNAWVPVKLRWSDFHRASWEENADAPFAKANQVTGMAFGVGTESAASTIWVDDVALLDDTATEDATPETGQSAPPTESKPEKKSLPPCAGAIVLPLSLIAGLAMRNRKQE